MAEKKQSGFLTKMAKSRQMDKNSIPQQAYKEEEQEVKEVPVKAEVKEEVVEKEPVKDVNEMSMVELQKNILEKEGAAKKQRKNLVNQQAGFRINKGLKADITAFKSVVGIKFDYEALARLLDFWVANADESQRALYKQLSELNRNMIK